MGTDRQDYEAVLRARLAEAKKRDEVVEQENDELSFMPALFAGLGVALLVNALITLLPA